MQEPVRFLSPNPQTKLNAQQPSKIRNPSRMKTRKLIFIAPLIVTVIILFIASMAYGEDCGRDPTTGRCKGKCPPVFTVVNGKAMKVEPYSDVGQKPCHEIQSECKCEYRTSGTLGDSTCHLDQQQQLCIGGCSNLYPTKKDAEAGTNPINFAHRDCHTFTTGNQHYCVCIYY